MEEEKKRAGSKLNIAIIHPDLGIGGAERLIVDAAVELASYGHNVHIFTSHHDKTRCFEETLGGTFPVTVYGGFLPRHIFYRFHAVCAYLRGIFVSLCMLFMWPSFDVILADQALMRGLFGLPRRTCADTPILALLTSVRRGKPKSPSIIGFRKIYRKPIDFLEEITTGMADLILVNSKFTASTFANTFNKLDAQGIRPAVLYPAVNMDQFQKPDAFKLNFLSINRYERKKNIELAISAFAMLCTLGGNDDQSYNFPDASLIIAGGFDKRLKENVEYLEELKTLAQNKGISDQVKFVTSCSTTKRNELLSQCLCVVYTPKDEHFGIVPLEAMAAHKPVIACNSGGPVETVKNGETGFLCDPSPEAFSLSMASFLKDPQLAERMGAKARKHVNESFSTKIFGQRLSQFLVDIVRRKRE